MQDGRVRDAALALGGVAHRPWRVRAAEEALIGQPLVTATMTAAADALLAGAQPLRHNAFKIELARRAVHRALASAGDEA